MVHLVYCDKKAKVLDKILNGTKTMVIRGAGGRKIPHGRVNACDALYFMETGSKKISAKAVVSDVQNFEKLTDEETDAVIEKNQPRLNLTEVQKVRWHKKCLCLIGFKGVEAVGPFDFDHQSNMDDWLMVNKIEDVIVGTSIPYNYDLSRLKR